MIEISDIEKELAQESGGTDNKSRAVITRFADIQSEPINWLWPDRIALGKLSLIVGDSDLGKSILTATMAAIISKGYVWPANGTPAPIGDVIMLSAEDDGSDTIKPRLEAAGADCSRVHLLEAVRVRGGEGDEAERMFSLKEDVAVLDKLLPSLPECKLLTIDPISSYLGETDSHRNAAVRGLLAPLAAFARRHRIAVIGIDHLNKNSNESNPLYRPGGSLAFVAAARAVYLVTKDKNNPERRLILPIKNNLSKERRGFAYAIVAAESGQPVIAWESEPVVLTAAEALTPVEPKKRTATDDAADFLLDLLANGAMEVSKIQEEVERAGVSEKTLRLARERLGVKSKRIGAKDGYWMWALPIHEDALISEVALPKTEGTLGGAGHLRSGEATESSAQGDMSAEEEVDSIPDDKNPNGSSPPHGADDG